MKSRVLYQKHRNPEPTRLSGKTSRSPRRLGPNENPDKPGLSFERKTEVGQKTSGFSAVLINYACIRVFTLSLRRENRISTSTTDPKESLSNKTRSWASCCASVEPTVGVSKKATHYFFKRYLTNLLFKTNKLESLSYAIILRFQLQFKDDCSTADLEGKKRSQRKKRSKRY